MLISCLLIELASGKNFMVMYSIVFKILRDFTPPPKNKSVSCQKEQIPITVKIYLFYLSTFFFVTVSFAASDSFNMILFPFCTSTHNLTLRNIALCFSNANELSLIIEIDKRRGKCLVWSRTWALSILTYNLAEPIW